MIVNVLIEQRRKGRKEPRGLVRVLQIAGTVTLITILWSLWNATSVGVWLDVITWWKIG